MRINFGKIAFSLVLCSCLLGCGQVKEAVCAALDDDAEETAAAQSGCAAGNAAGCAEEASGAVNGSAAEPNAYVGNGGGCDPGQGQLLSANTGANPGGNKYSLVDPGTNMVVETYKLPAGWQGTGQVVRPPKKNITWQSIFLHPQAGSVGFRNYSTSYDGVGPFRNSPVLQNNNLANGMLSDLRQFLNMQNVQVVSADLSPHDTPENRQTIQFAKSKIAPGIQINFSPLQYHAVVSMNCSGQPYKGDLVSNLLCWEYNAGRVMMHGVCIQNCYGVVSPVSQMTQERKAVLAILSSRRENPQWKQYSEQSAVQQTQQLSGHYDRMNQIVQDKNNYISNVQNEMNQNNAATQDRVRQGWHEAITGRTDVANPMNPGTAVTTDNNYNRAWTNSQGQVINTDSELYNPNSDQDLNGVEWTQIK